MRVHSPFQPEDPQLNLEPDGFHDSQGRVICFRGVNIAANAKLPPFVPFEDSCWWDLLTSWGYNIVRLTIFWEAIEPEPGLYDHAYLEKIEEMLNQAARRGIYVLLDMHQDLYSRWLHGDGAPEWTFPEEIDPKNNDSFGGRFWGMAYILSKDVRACFANFFRSSQLKAQYCNAWMEVAKRVGGNPYVLGYDIMNEPSCGDIPNNAGQFENDFLKPFYEYVIASIRQIHPAAVGFIEPNLQDMYTSKLTPFSIDDVVYAPHFYNPLSNTLQFDPFPEDISFDLLLMVHQEKAKYLHMPLFIGEFGSPWGMQPFYARNMAVDNALKAMEKDFVSNAYWDFSVRDVAVWNEEDYSLIDEEGRPRGLGVNVRPYVRRLRGSLLCQNFDQLTKKYSLRFKSEPGMPQTVICIPESVQYSNGFQIYISDGYKEYVHDREELMYSPSYDGYHNITIKPRYFN
jgi:endoglycosylceramidase